MRKILSYSLLFLLFCQSTLGQNYSNSNINKLIDIATLCQKTLAKSAMSHSFKMYSELKTVLDTLDKHEVEGVLPACLLSDMITNSVIRKDTLAAFTHMVDLRNRSYNKLYKDITNPFNYGLGRLSPSSNHWTGESVISMLLYRMHALALLDIHAVSASPFAYDALLHTKGMKLMADNTFKFMADESNNQKIGVLYRELILLQNKYTELDLEYKSNFGKRKEEFDLLILDYPKLKLLKDAITTKKDSIFSLANKNYSYVNKFFSPWTNIQKRLSESEIAIEFASINTYSKQKKYIALTIDKSNGLPVFLNLCNEEDLKSIDPTNREGLMKLNKLIWKPLESLIKNKNKIYFSADGLLHTLPIEYAMVDKKIYRLSSTRELIRENNPQKIMKVVAFGGIDYEKYDINSNHKKRFINGSSFSSVTRGTRGALPWTLVEVENLERIVNAFVYKGEKGSEESFYKLVNTDYNILHIATHGFYYSSDELKEKMTNKQKYAFIDFNNQNISSELTYSGLILSGANNALRGNPIPRGYEDGILTAKEIASTHLSNFDMVVLSTCQSGLGEITSEGVYGLQRGFKMAGVNTILMSLWEVDDKATQILMTEFYSQILLGESKQIALMNAQKSVRQFNKEYQDPYYWAGFILIDALN